MSRAAVASKPDAYEHLRVVELRRLGRGWQSIAQTIGRSLPDTMRLHAIADSLPVIRRSANDAEPPRKVVDWSSITWRPRCALDLIMDRVCETYLVTREDIDSTTRKANVVRARQAFCALAHEAGKSYPQIGAYLGRHHTVAMHNAKQHWARSLKEAA